LRDKLWVEDYAATRYPKNISLLNKAIYSKDRLKIDLKGASPDLLIQSKAQGSGKSIGIHNS
jgi:hypothetical protein